MTEKIHRRLQNPIVSTDVNGAQANAINYRTFLQIMRRPIGALDNSLNKNIEFAVSNIYGKFHITNNSTQDLIIQLLLLRLDTFTETSNVMNYNPFGNPLNPVNSFVQSWPKEKDILHPMTMIVKAGSFAQISVTRDFFKKIVKGDKVFGPNEEFILTATSTTLSGQAILHDYVLSGSLMFNLKTMM